MPEFISYYRVSTDRQGVSGLGLEAQRDAVLANIGKGKLLAEYTEVESGKKHTNRPQLLAALQDCKKRRAALVIAKLDRLGRNVAFISALMESGVEFICCDNPHANRLMLHLLAAFAEHERELISERTKAALQQVKREIAAKGFRVSRTGNTYTKLGNPKLAQAREKALHLRREERPSDAVANMIVDLRAAGKTFRQISARLNGMNIRTPRGCRWYAASVRAVCVVLHAMTPASKQAITLPRYEDVTLSRFDVETPPLPEQLPQAIPSVSPSNAGREAKTEGGDMSGIPEAQQMIDIFTSVGARSFVVTKLDLLQVKIWGKAYDASDLRALMPEMVRTSLIHKPVRVSEEQTITAGENLIIRPSGPATSFIQLDDLTYEHLDRVRPAAFIMIGTSPGNHQAWLAVSRLDRDKEAEKDIMRRVRKAVGSTDQSASGATRVAGTQNFKVKYAPEFPTIHTLDSAPGRTLSIEQLKALGLLAPPDPVQQWTPVVSNGRSGPDGARRWPDYGKCLAGAPLNAAGTGPDRSKADYTFCLFAAQRGCFTVDEIASELMTVSHRARERFEQGDKGYALITAKNATAAAARGRIRSRA